MKYIEKNIVTSSNYTASCWVAVSLEAILYRPYSDPGSAQPGDILFLGWKDVESLIAGATPVESVRLKVSVPDISLLQTYSAMMTELIGVIVTDQDSPLCGGEVKDTPEPEPEPEPE